MNSLLTKKGLNNAKTIDINESNSDSSNSDYHVDADGVYSSDSTIETDNIKTHVHQQLAENGESQNSGTNSKDVFVQCTSEQLGSIDYLLHEKNVDKAGQLRVLDKFGIVSFAELSEKQADSVIKKLNSLESTE